MRDQVLDEVLAEENAKREARREARAAKTAPGAGAEQGRPKVGVRGITGSLTAFEVEQAMSARSAELLACVHERPHTLGHVAGDIAFHVDVDGRGRVERVLVMQSDIGYAPLEECLLAVVQRAPFPAPAGARRAETQWRMSVDPLREPAEPVEVAELEETIARESEETYETCELGKAQRFVVHGYLAHGKLQALNVRTPWRGAAQSAQDSPEQLACLRASIARWSAWPKAQGNVKVAFELRWVKAPPPSHARGRVRRRR